MPDFKSRAQDLDGVVHVMNYQTVNYEWLTMCGRWDLSFEESDYVALMPDATETDAPATCLVCLANEDRWNDDGTRKQGREWD